MNSTKKKIYRMFKGQEYSLIQRDIRVGDLILLNFNTRHEIVTPIASEKALNYISRHFKQIQNKSYFILKPEME